MTDYFKLINAFQDLKIFVIGDIILDIYLYGDVNRISPEAPVPVVEVKKELSMLGGATNVAANLNALGVNVSIAGVVGNDTNGKKIKKMLQAKGISDDMLLCDDRRTTVKTRIIAGSQQVVRFDHENKDNLSLLQEEDIILFLENNINDFDGIIISDYGKGLITQSLVHQITYIAKENKKVLTVDPKVENFYLYNGVTCITPNNKEASEATSIRIDKDDSLMRCGIHILEKLNLDCLLITMGKDGMAVFNKDRTYTHIHAVAKEVFDVTGAGDTVISVFTAALAYGANYVDAAKLANIAAGIVIGKIGTATVSAPELSKNLLSFINELK